MRHSNLAIYIADRVLSANHRIVNRAAADIMAQVDCYFAVKASTLLPFLAFPSVHSRLPLSAISRIIFLVALVLFQSRHDD